MVDNFSEICKLFQRYGIKEPSIEARRLFELLSVDGKHLDTNLLQQKIDLDLNNLAIQRKKGVPLEYILGIADFMGEKYFCTSETFIPKHQTELLCTVALDILNGWKGENNIVVDVGTGCGNIVITLALNSSNSSFLASDINPKALEITQKNIKKFGLQERINLCCCDILLPFESKGTMDLIVCNPPYIPTGSLNKLPSEIVDFEPRNALDGGHFGIDFIIRLIGESSSILKPGGILVFEMCPWQENLISRILDETDAYEKAQYFSDGTECKVISIVRK